MLSRSLQLRHSSEIFGATRIQCSDHCSDFTCRHHVSFSIPEMPFTAIIFNVVSSPFPVCLSGRIPTFIPFLHISQHPICTHLLVLFLVRSVRLGTCRNASYAQGRAACQQWKSHAKHRIHIFLIIFLFSFILFILSFYMLSSFLSLSLTLTLYSGLEFTERKSFILKFKFSNQTFSCIWNDDERKWWANDLNRTEERKKRTTNTPTTFQNRNGETVKKPRKQTRDQMKSVEIYGTNLFKFLFSFSSHFLLYFFRGVFLFRIQFCRFALARHFVPKIYHNKFAGEFGFFFLVSCKIVLLLIVRLGITSCKLCRYEYDKVGPSRLDSCI